MNIAIKLPNDTRERLAAFPFLYTLERILSEKLGEDEILNLHLIAPKKDIDILNLLPFKAFYHEIADEDLKNVFTMHRACKLFTIDRIEEFVSTTTSFADASIGKNIGAKLTMGFDAGKNKWMLKKVMSKPEGHLSDQIYSLLNFFTTEVPPIRSIFARTLPEFYPDWSEKPYTVINLPCKGVDIDGQDWIDFFELFEEQTFVLMSAEIEEEMQEVALKDFIQKLSKKNTYKVFEFNSHIEFGKLVTYALCFYSGTSYLAHLAAYCGATTFYSHKDDDLKHSGPKYFRGEIIELKDVQVEKTFDEVYAFIDARTKKDESKEESD